MRGGGARGRARGARQATAARPGAGRAAGNGAAAGHGATAAAALAAWRGKVRVRRQRWPLCWRVAGAWMSASEGYAAWWLRLRRCSVPRSGLRSRLRLVNMCRGVSAAPWWRVPTSVLLGRTLVSPWWRRWLRLCGGSPATPWWWSGDAGRLFTAVMMRVKTHPSLGRRRWRHWRHFLPKGDVEHLWLEPCSYLWTVSWASVSHVRCGR